MTDRLLCVVAIATMTLSGGARAQSRSHELKLEPKNIHWGYYDAKVPPVLPSAILRECRMTHDGSCPTLNTLQGHLRYLYEADRPTVHRFRNALLVFDI